MPQPSDLDASPAKRRVIGQARLVNLGKLEGNCVFISDVHLMEPFDEHTLFFLASLEKWGAQAKHIFLMGDIFEFIDASAAFFHKRWKVVFDTLEALKSHGVSIYFIEGNHDFGFEFRARFERKIRQKENLWMSRWATFAGDAALEFEHENLGLVHVRHGDDVVTHPAYMRLRHFVKSSFAQHVLSLLPSRPVNAFFLRAAKESRKRGESYVMTPEKLFGDVQQFFMQTEMQIPDLLVIGHIHVYADGLLKVSRSGMDKEGAHRDVRVLSGPDWHTKPSVLSHVSGQKIGRTFLTYGKGEIPQLFTAHQLQQDLKSNVQMNV